MSKEPINHSLRSLWLIIAGVVLLLVAVPFVFHALDVAELKRATNQPSSRFQTVSYEHIGGGNFRGGSINLLLVVIEDTTTHKQYAITNNGGMVPLQ